MKFRIKEKDLIIFVIFCVFLLYLCAVAVMNFITFRESGAFYGLSPFEAFSPSYFKYTIFLFFGVLIAIFASVSSYIFAREKGKPGIVLGEKEEKGYSRWATDKELKGAKDVAKILVQQPTATAAGVPLMNNGKEMYVDNGESHTLVIGATASGKTTSVVNPLVISLSKKGESMIITDPKGEIYKEHCNMLKAKGYNVVVLNFRDPSKGSSWNPLSLPYKLYKEGNRDKSIELLDDVARNIFIDPNNKADPFWEKSAVDYFAGIALGLFEDAKESEVNINTISYMATVGEEKLGTTPYIKEYFGLKGEESSCYTFASNTINAPTDTKGSILSIFRQKIRIFATKEDLSEMLAVTDFDIRKIGSDKTAIFLVIHDEKTTYHALATIFIKQVYETLIDVAYKEPSGKLPHRTNFILDEFANMPPLKDVTSMVTAARSRDIRFTFIIQNFAQLKQVYGADDAETIKSNCGNMIYLITTELAALEEISKLCGEVKSKDKEKTASVPLVTVAELQKMKMNEVIIRRIRLNPFRTKLTPSYKIDWGEKFDKAEFYSREKNKIELFDLKEFVKEKKRNKLFNDLDQKGTNGNTNAFGNPYDMPLPNYGMPSRGINGNSPFYGAQNDIDFLRPNQNNVMPNSNYPNTPFGQVNNNQMPINNGLNSPYFNQSGLMNNPMGNQAQNMNLDDLVKKIDAQLADLEKEDANRKKDVSNQPFIDNRKTNSTTNNSFPTTNNLQDVSLPSIEKPIDNEATIKPTPVVEPIKPEIVDTSINNEAIDKEDLDTLDSPNIMSNNTNKHEETESELNVTDNSIQQEEKPKVNVDVDSIIVNNNVVNDDDFFDDFFADE